MKNKLNFLIFILFCLTHLCINAQVQVPQNGLIGWWPFNGNANDGSGNNNHGILGGQSQNPQLTTDRFGNANSAYLFGGYYNKNWITIPNDSSMLLTNKMSLSFWFQQCDFSGMDGWGRYSTTGAGFTLISKAGDGNAACPGFFIQSSINSQTGTLGLSSNNYDGWRYNNGLAQGDYGLGVQYACFDTCEWMHVVCVTDDTIVKIYINGILFSRSTTAPYGHPSFAYANQQDLYFGRMACSSTIWFPYNGKLDDIAFYNRALSDAEVRQLYGNFPDPHAANNRIIINSINVNTACNGNDGSITITPDTTNGPFQYAIDSLTNFQNSNSFSNISGTTHRIYVKSACGLWDTVIDFSCNRIRRTVCHGDTIMLPAGAWFTDSNFTQRVVGNVVRPNTNTTYYSYNQAGGNGITFSYTGTVQTYTIPSGVDSVLLQVWGAQGGQGGPNNIGGKGGYSEGKMRVTPGQVLYIYVGGQGRGSSLAEMLNGQCAGGWNGGGDGNNYMSSSGSSNGVRGGGGGATDISLQGTAGSATWNTNNHLYSRVIVAGGGGGNLYFSTLSNTYSAGVGGGTSGGNGLTTSNSVAGYGGTQGVGGNNASSYANYTNSSFGAGASGSTGQYTLCGGGGGWYGGGAGNAAGGGSGYVYTAGTASSYPQGCLLTAANYLGRAATYAGNTSFPDTSGLGTEVGHSGNGFAKITTGLVTVLPPIEVTVLPSYRDTIHDTICAGSSFTLGDSTYSQQGFYPQNLQTMDGCDSIVVIDLTVLDTFRTQRYDTICNGQRFNYGNNSYSTAGTYPQLHSSVNGCDSIAVVNLFVKDTFHVFVYDTVCAGNTYTYNNQSYTIAGTYLQNYQTVQGCDSVIHIVLNVNDTIRAHIYDTICYRQYYLFNGNTYGSTGIYRHMTRNPQGCDSITYLHLQVNDTSVTHIFDTTYNGIYTYLDSTYTVNGTYRYLLHKKRTGCDSTIVLHLKLCDSVITNLTDTVCNDSTYYFGGRLITRSGTYTKVLTSCYGCDSIVILNIVMVNYPTLSIRAGTYCEGEKVEISAVTNGNYITWSSSPYDSTLAGQEHNDTIFVAPQRGTIYTATVDSVPRFRTCLSVKDVQLTKPSRVIARFTSEPGDITINSIQTKFTDVSIGEITQRKWLLHEDNPSAPDKHYNNEISVYFTPTEQSDSVEVTLMVTNNVGCHDTAIRIFPIIKGDVWVPNAFTPDANSNYLFKVGTNNLGEYEISIYTRAGLLVFHSTDPSISWDGTYNGKPCVAGAYTYVINYTTSVHKKQPLQKVGSVLLIR